MASTTPHLGHLLKLLRDQRRWTQEVLAEKSGVSARTVYRVEQAAAKGEEAPQWRRQNLMAILAALHKHTPLSNEQMEEALLAAGIPAPERPTVETSIRSMAGEFDGLQERLEENSRKQSVSLLDELVAKRPQQLFDIQALVELMAELYGIQRVHDALRSLKIAWDAEAKGAPTIPGAVKHASGQTTVYTPTTTPQTKPGGQLKRKRSS